MTVIRVDRNTLERDYQKARSVEELAEQYDVSISTLYYWLKTLNIKRDRRKYRNAVRD